MPSDYIYTNEGLISVNHLSHHGVPGMKLGVRRYEKNAGSYTQKGLKNYKLASDKYQRSREKFKSVKSSKNREEIKNARYDIKRAKKELNKSYKQLAIDKKADQGKRLYAEGKTITGNMQKNAIAQVGIVVGSKAVQSMLSTYGNHKVASIAGTAVGIGGTAVNAMLAGKTMRDNNRLRAYYGHSRET